MKKVVLVSFFLVLTFCRSKNDFENTTQFLEFDKETYRLDDNFELTIEIYPNETEQTIRFYKDFNNILRSFLSKKSEQHVVEDVKPSSLNQPGKEYPMVNSQGYARFCIEAPYAQAVKASLGLGGRGGTTLFQAGNSIYATILK